MHNNNGGLSQWSRGASESWSGFGARPMTTHSLNQMHSVRRCADGGWGQWGQRGGESECKSEWGRPLMNGSHLLYCSICEAPPTTTVQYSIE